MNHLITQTLNETRFERGLVADASDARELLRSLAPLLSSLESLLHCSVKQAQRHELEEIRISTSRATELHRDIVASRQRVKATLQRNTTRQHALDAHLDSIHNL